MDWGQYLCKGPQSQASTGSKIENESSKRNDNMKQDSELYDTKLNKSESKEEDDEHLQLALRRLEKALQILGLSPFSARMALQFIASRIQAEQSQVNLQRVIAYLLALVNPSPSYHTHIRRGREGCGQVIPHLRSLPFWDHMEEFQPLIGSIREHFSAIRKELIELRHLDIQHCDPIAAEKDGEVRRLSECKTSANPVTSFQSYRSPGNNVVEKGEWNVCYLSLHGMDFSRNSSRCPVTMSVVEPVVSSSGKKEALYNSYGHAFFSALSPDAYITPHYGPTNKKLRVYVPLFVPEGMCFLEVNGIRRDLQEGVPIIFDDSFLHSAANKSLNEPRLNLIFDVWHPDLSETEVSS